MLAALDRAVQAGQSALADRRSGQKSLFAGFSDEPAPPARLPDVPESPERELLLMEKEVLGCYLTSHPLDEYESTLSVFRSHTTAQLAALPEQAEVVLGGMLSAIRVGHVRKARPGATATRFANFDLEDLHGMVRCIVWPEEFVTIGQYVRPDAILIARGIIDRRGGDETNMIVRDLIPLEQLDARCTSGIVVRLDVRKHDAAVVRDVREIVRGHPGSQDLWLTVQLEDGSRVHLKAHGVRLDVSAALRAQLAERLGAGGVQVLVAGSGRNGLGDARSRPMRAPST
jgi:DNA polymerase-3 subunit alpha